ncbi:hypothetical protein LAZ67_11001881 [Cordylochernes scorpioides]|uniref:Transposase n=1 Tax=Cordylochernes scorpioides TaxID=51811 RepID=A0ABY6L2M0_9ARAC|nr:hypothetical protein LAZ67_11001881 [Cordylochernes scorpioides]
MNSDLYCDILVNKLKPGIRNKRRGKLNEGVFFLHDNARPHTSCKTVSTIIKLGFEVLEHPAYSPDLAPSDYFLFGLLKIELKGKRFDSDEDVQKVVQDFFQWCQNDGDDVYRKPSQSDVGTHGSAYPLTSIGDPHANCTSILQNRQDTLDNSISTRSFSRRMFANGLHSCRLIDKNDGMAQGQVLICVTLQFSIDSRSIYVWRRRRERFNPAAFVERFTPRQLEIMVWGAIAYDTSLPLVHIQGTMMAQRYVDDVLPPVTLHYLQGYPIPFISRITPDRTMLALANKLLKDSNLFSKFLNLKYNDKDDLDNYFKEKSSLAKKLNLDTPLLLEALTEGMPNYLKKYLIAARVKETSDWIRIATQLKYSTNQEKQQPSTSNNDNRQNFQNRSYYPTRSRFNPNSPPEPHKISKQLDIQKPIKKMKTVKIVTELKEISEMESDSDESIEIDCSHNPMDSFNDIFEEREEDESDNNYSITSGTIDSGSSSQKSTDSKSLVALLQKKQV